MVRGKHALKIKRSKAPSFQYRNARKLEEKSDLLTRGFVNNNSISNNSCDTASA